VSGQVVSAGSQNISWLSGDKGTVRVGNQSWGSISNGSSKDRGGGHWQGSAVSSEVISPGGDHSWLVSWDHSSVGVGH